jgi:hypothetical protein
LEELVPFDPLSWALGYGLGKVATAVIDNATSKDLQKRLREATESWAKVPFLIETAGPVVAETRRG